MIFLQRTFTSLVHAHAGRTPVGEADRYYAALRPGGLPKALGHMMNKALVFWLAFVVSHAVQGEGMSIQDHPRYGPNPVYIFFEAYIQDVVGFLPEEKSASIQSMNIQGVFDTKASDWRDVVKETLHLSDTIDIAILDLWYRNRGHFTAESGGYDPVWFSQVFTDEYMKDGSTVDVWPEGALAAAKSRIAEASSGEGE